MFTFLSLGDWMFLLTIKVAKIKKEIMEVKRRMSKICKAKVAYVNGILL